MKLITKLTISTLLSAASLAVAITSTPAHAKIRSCRAVFNPAAGETLSLSIARRGAAAARTSLRPLHEVTELRILQYNVENLFMSVGKHERLSPSEFKQIGKEQPKSPEDLVGIAKPMRELDPDIMVLEEVESLRSLTRFSNEYLSDRYRPLLVEGNDARGIDIGFLVKRDLPLSIEIESHKDVEWVDPIDRQKHKLFSRDLPALLVRRAGEKNSSPLLIILGNHAKSMRDRSGDPNSNIMRAAQYEGAGKIIDQYQRRFGKDVPIMMAGDFNTEVRAGFPGSAAVEPIHDRLVESFSSCGVAGPACITHSYHPRGGSTEYTQIDAIFVSPSLRDSVLSAQTYRYKDRDGDTLPLPKTWDERNENPSDHFPVMVTIGTERIFPEAHTAKAAGQ